MADSSVEERIDRETLYALKSSIKSSKRRFNDDMDTIDNYRAKFQVETSPLMRAGAAFIKSKEPSDILADYDSVIKKITNILGY